METNKEYSFDCNEWLSREKTDGEIVREFAMKKDGDEKKPPSKLAIKIFNKVYMSQQLMDKTEFKMLAVECLIH